MAVVEPIKIEGLREFVRDLKKLDGELPKAVRLAGNEAAELVVAWARPRVPKRSGAAARSVKARSTRTRGRVVGGSKKVPYYAWLDFGGTVGRGRQARTLSTRRGRPGGGGVAGGRGRGGGSVRRPFIKSGRYIYPGFMKQKDEVYDTYVRALVDVARQAGIEVTE